MKQISKFKKILLSLLSLVVVFIIIATILTINLFTPVTNDKNAEYVKFGIPYGTNSYVVTQELKKQNLIKNPKVFYYLLLRPKYLKMIYPSVNLPEKLDFQCGLYKISPNMNYAQIIEIFATGKKEILKVSIPEGLTISKIAKILEENEICNAQKFIEAAHDKELLTKLNINADSAEGYLFPDTYYFDYGMPESGVVTLMVNTFKNQIKQLSGFENLTAEKLHEIVTLASIVEREYRLPEEAPLIASVFTNRIKNSIGLYSCATVEYVITEILGKEHPKRIFESDLKIDNPYNTYMYSGLTPGPISNPGKVALQAAAKPAKTDYFYFQVADPSIGKHVFNKTFSEHVQNHNLYTKD